MSNAPTTKTSPSTSGLNKASPLDEAGDGAASGPSSVRVIVPVHNGERSLHRCLEALAKSDRTPDRVIVVDDGSTDGSASVGRTLGVEVLSIPPGPIGPAAARNRAAREADEHILCFLDSDVEPRADTLDELLAPFDEEPAIVAAFGSYDDHPAAAGVASLYANLRHHHIHQRGDPDAQTFWAGCGAVRREAFEQVGGFEQSFGEPSIEDIDLGVRLKQAGGRIRLLRQAQVKHLKRWTIIQLWRTDITRRAAPWSRLIARGHGSGQLNTSRGEQASAVGAHCLWAGGLAAIVIHPLVGTSALLAAVIWVGINRKLLGLLARRGGVKALIGGAVLHWIYHLYASVTYVLVTTRHRLSAPRERTELSPSS